MQGNEPPYAEIRDIIEHFKAVPHVSDEALKEYCERKHYQPLTAQAYEDWLYQYHADIRTETFIHDAMQVISRYRPKRALSTQAEKDAVDVDKNGIEVDLCQLLEKHDILYDRHVDNMLQELATALGTVVRNASIRANNMGARVLSAFAEEKLGSPLTFKALGEEFRRRNPAEEQKQ
jgi:hypothetical protein